MRRSVALLFIIGLLGSRCRTDKSLVDCHARDPRLVAGGHEFRSHMSQDCPAEPLAPRL